MEEKYYAILMNKKILEPGIYYYSPQALIEGDYIDEDQPLFVDSVGNEYLTIHDAETVFNDLEIGVAYVITESELLKKYNTDSLEEVKARYFDEICNASHFGFFIYKEDVVAVVPMNFKEMASELNAEDTKVEDIIIKFDMDSLSQPENIINSYCSESENAKTECVMIEIETLKDIINSKNYEEVIKKLKQIYPDEIKNALNGKEILKFFEDGYNAIRNTESSEEINNIIIELVGFYVNLSLKFDEFEEDKDIEDAKNFLYNLIDSYDKALEKEDIEIIKKEILEQESATKNCMQHLAKIYDKSVLKKEQVKKEEKKDLNAKDMKTYFDQRIIGQEEAKVDVISAIVMNSVTDDYRSKNSCLLIGPTGSGKTLIAETVSEYLDKPIEIVDTTQQTIPGYQGANIEDFLIRLLNKAGGDIKKAEEGIVVFDEIDKKGSEKNSDVSGKGVLNSLLSFLHGTTYNLNYNGRVIPFNTSKLTIFATGAFTDVAKSKKSDNGSSDYSTSKIGYISDIKLSSDTEDIVYEKFEAEDLIKYGNMPSELMGRFSTITQLSGHTKESLRKILTESVMSPLIQEQAKLVKLNVNLTWDDDYIDEVCVEALKQKMGARSLKKIVERTIKVARWQAILNLNTISEIKLTKKTVLDNYNCDLVDNNGNIINLQDLITKDDDVLKRVRK